ncbi:MAG: VanZ family protein [Methylicorpusculum sp.]|uniref:VanZ family protein n=1 Tax=Methylicorpusculum sp. TaxID=2713644 RepID=UPI00271A3FB0|nr:VanZ family protein [Methylicorpusculum sp.]MDO8844807.1 VanZ family protein [Methylicorpusculum sp.]MDO8938004.1 VanZ family protein [Methylicorpusculum sp.]MDO9241908.1 VanZ family protein [Methylicorpusculum sp.]MDP2177779.1 VanZ family protein [Methylicorpusculum sp.]MDP2201586.1 VanZ family protein [Methylicorpusculum sp.]
MTQLLDTLALIIYCSFIYWLSDQPSVPVPMWFDHQDKLYHGGAYFIMAILTWRLFRHFTAKPWLIGILAFIFCSLFGLSDEWHQSFVAGRYADLADWLADSVGAMIGIMVIYRLTSRTRIR